MIKEECCSVLHYPIKQQESKAIEKATQIIAIKRRIEKSKNKREAAAKRLENKLYSTLIKNGSLDDVLPNLSMGLQDMARSIITDPKQLVNLHITHIWTDDDKDILHFGKIIQYKAAKKEYKIAYWKEEEDYDASCDICYKLKRILSDVCTGLLHFR